MNACLKWLSVFSLSVSALSVSACGGKDDSGDDKSAEEGGSSSKGGASAKASSSSQGGDGTKASSANHGGASTKISSSAGGASAGLSAHLSECQAICQRTTEAGCSGDESSCTMICSTITGLPNCQSQITAWLNCAKTSTVTCDSSGEPTFSGCSTEQTSAMGCAFTQEPAQPVKSTCTSYCDAAKKAGCNGEVQAGLSCEQACGLGGSLISTCQDVYVKYMDCQLKGTITCASDGSPQVSGCDTEENAYAECMMQQLGGGIIPSGN